MKIKTTKVFQVGIHLALLFAIWVSPSCTRSDSSKESSQTPKKIVIGTFSEAIDYGPSFVARHFGWFEQSLNEVGNFEVEYRQLDNFADIEIAIVKGELTAFFSAEAPIIKLVSGKQAIKIVEVGCTLQQDILVRTGSKISSISDLKGKTIAVAEGTSSHYGLLKILGTANLTKNDVTLKTGFPGFAKPLFETGGVDAWAVWPPFVEEQVIANRGQVLSGGNAKIQSVMSFSTASTDEDLRIRRAIYSALRRAKEWMSQNPDQAITIVAQRMKLDRQIVALAWPKHNWSAELDQSVIDDITEKTKFLISVQVVQPGSEPLVDSTEKVVDLSYRPK